MPACASPAGRHPRSGRASSRFCNPCSYRRRPSHRRLSAAVGCIESRRPTRRQRRKCRLIARIYESRDRPVLKSSSAASPVIFQSFSGVTKRVSSKYATRGMRASRVYLRSTIFFMVVHFVDAGDLEAVAPRHGAQVDVHGVHAVVRGRETHAHVKGSPTGWLTTSFAAMLRGGSVPRSIARTLRFGQGGGAFVNPLPWPSCRSKRPRAVSFSDHGLPHAASSPSIRASRRRMPIARSDI
jgi:hypothetical protein